MTTRTRSPFWLRPALVMLLGAALFVNWGKLTAAFRKPVPAQNNR